MLKLSEQSLAGTSSALPVLVSNNAANRNSIRSTPARLPSLGEEGPLSARMPLAAKSLGERSQSLLHAAEQEKQKILKF